MRNYRIFIFGIFLIFSFNVFASQSYFVIKVLDEQTGRGVPLVEFSTTNNISYYTDSQGVFAFYELGLMNREVYFHIKSHGYKFEKDFFGFVGKALTTTQEKTSIIKIRRKNLAERIYRVTGQGIYADSIKANLSVPLNSPVLCARVMGQDSALATIYKNNIFWFWGNTSKAAYPLGLFRVSVSGQILPASLSQTAMKRLSV